MSIVIKDRYKPFSHKPGASCVIPGTCFEITAFPALLRVAGREIKLACTGPVEGFTLELDLDRRCVFVFGKAQEGFFKLRIEASDAGFTVSSERGKALKEAVFIAQEMMFAPKGSLEALSLGSHKAQDWDRIGDDLKSALPILYCLSQMTPRVEEMALVGTARLLDLGDDRNNVADKLQMFLQAAFTKLLIPRLTDDEHQGFISDEKVEGNPFFLIQEAKKKIRALFFQQNERRVKFLPNLPVPFDCGRFTGIKAPGIGEIDLEWSKKLLRQVVVRASTSGEVVLELQREIKSFRVGRKKKQEANEPLLVEAGKTYLLDRFQK